jgi:hypothetical protein
MRHCLLPTGLALLLGLAAPMIPGGGLFASAPAQAQQSGPEWPGLRGVTELRTYIGFAGRPESLATCGITPEVQAAAFDTLRLLPEGAGMRILTRQFERVQVPNTVTQVLVGTPRNAATTTIGVTVVVLAATPPGGTPMCTLAVDMGVRTQATGSRITATGMVLDGPLQIWHDDQTDLIPAANAAAELRSSIEDGMRNLIRFWQEANGRPQTAAPTPPAPPPAPPANAPRTGGSKG